MVRHLFKRHPLAITAWFEFSLVLTYAAPVAMLQPLLRPGLALDLHGDLGFIAIALVRTRRLRPAGFPAWCGHDFFLAGYRLFTRYTTQAGRTLRGLQILRSETDSRWMTWLGSVLTHYRYIYVTAKCEQKDKTFHLETKAPDGASHFSVRAHVPSEEPALPVGSPFASWAEARRFAGPMPFTFSYEPETHSMIRVEGVRQEWKPQPMAVEQAESTWLQTLIAKPEQFQLANAFLVTGVPYYWNRGLRETL